MSEQTLGAASIAAIQKLAETAQVHDIVAFRPPAEPADVYYIGSNRKGDFVRMVAEPGDYIEQHWHSDAVVAFVAANPTGGTIYISDGQIVGVVTNADGKRRRIARFGFGKQDPFLDLTGAVARGYEKTIPFWNRLRTVHRDTIDQNIAARFRNVEFKSGDIVTATAGHDTKGQNRRYAESATDGDAGSLPDEITFQVGVYSVQQRRFDKHAVVCAIDISGSQEGFKIIPVANSLERAREAALDVLEKDIRDAINEALPDKATAQTSTEANRTITIVRGEPCLPILRDIQKGCSGG